MAEEVGFEPTLHLSTQDQLATDWFQPSHPLFLNRFFKIILYIKKRKLEIKVKYYYSLTIRHFLHNKLYIKIEKIIILV